MLHRQAIWAASAVLALGLAVVSLPSPSSAITMLDADAAHDIIVGAASQCCVEHSRPACAANVAFTSCYSTGTPATTPPQCTNNSWFKIPCNPSQCVTGENPADKCATKTPALRKANLCRRKGTYTTGAPCNAGYARCDFEEVLFNAAAPANVNRDTSARDCRTDAGFVKCANGQPADACN